MHRVHMKRFNLKKLNGVEGKEQYHVEISNRFAAMEILDTEVVDIVTCYLRSQPIQRHVAR
jgi:hypothetical protein